MMTGLKNYKIVRTLTRTFEIFSISKYTITVWIWESFRWSVVINYHNNSIIQTYRLYTWSGLLWRQQNSNNSYIFATLESPWFDRQMWERTVTRDEIIMYFFPDNLYIYIECWQILSIRSDCKSRSLISLTLINAKCYRMIWNHI